MLLIFLSVVTSKSQELEILGYWDFNNPSDPAASSDVTGSSPDLEFIGGASYSNDGDGFSDGGGDYALDLGGVNDGSLAQTAEGDHLNTAYDNNAMSVVFWQKHHSNRQHQFLLDSLAKLVLTKEAFSPHTMGQWNHLL